MIFSFSAFANRRKLNKQLAKASKLDILKLHVGCGTQYKENWINIDNNSDNNIQQIDINWDLSKGLPFPPNSVDYIYHEHFIEHLSYKEGNDFLTSCFKALKAGGVMRIACPDLDLILDDYINDSWREREWVKKYGCDWFPSKCFMLNACLNQDPWGHKYVYNKEDMTAQLCRSGFSAANIAESTFCDSRHQQLKNIDNRNDSMFFEATK